MKEIASNPVWGADGKRIEFHVFPGNVGLKVVDPEKEPGIAEVLDRCSKNKILGIVEITKEQYEEYKKKFSLPQRKRAEAKPRLRLWNPSKMGSVAQQAESQGHAQGVAVKKDATRVVGLDHAPSAAEEAIYSDPQITPPTPRMKKPRVARISDIERAVQVGDAVASGDGVETLNLRHA